jgi:hypothetical protein
MLALMLTPELPDGPVTNAANSLIQAGILGALVLLMGMALGYVVLKWNRTNELRVKDQKEAMEAIQKSSESYTSLVTATTGALRDLVGTTDALKEAVKANTEASRTMERTLNETVREAIRAAGGYRRFTPTGTPGSSGPVAPAKGAGP